MSFYAQERHFEIAKPEFVILNFTCHSESEARDIQSLLLEIWISLKPCVPIHEILNLATLVQNDKTKMVLSL